MQAGNSITNTQNTNTGEYLVWYYNKYGAVLKDLTDTCKCLGQAQDTAQRRIHDPNDISQHESHYLPVDYVIVRVIEKSTDKKS